jgi:glyoxylase-like metal-dependent hydrolase (beta-lactamase superfamily II)
VKLEDVAYVAVSHIHLDHGGGVGTLLKSLANAKVIVHRRGAPHLIDPGKLWRQSQLTLGSLAKIFGALELVPNERILTAVDGMEIDVGDCLKLRVLETLGHASHHLSYHLPAYSGVFPRCRWHIRQRVSGCCPDVAVTVPLGLCFGFVGEAYRVEAEDSVLHAFR